MPSGVDQGRKDQEELKKQLPNSLRFSLNQAENAAKIQQKQAQRWKARFFILLVIVVLISAGVICALSGVINF